MQTEKDENQLRNEIASQEKRIGEMETEIEKCKKTKIALAKSEARFRSFAESASDGIVTTDVDGRVLFCNPVFKKIFGYSKGELVNQPLTILMPSRFRQGYLDALELFKSSGEHKLIGKTVETTGLKKDGTEFPFEMSLSAWKSGDEIYFSAIMRDITERKHAEMELKNSERQLNDIINHLPDATFAIDSEGKVIAWNRAIEEMTQVKASEIMGKGDYQYAIPFYGDRRPLLIDLIFKDEEEIEKLHYENIKKKGNSLMAETPFPHLHGKEVLLWGKASLLYDEEGNIVGAIESIRDITEQKRTEEKYRYIVEKFLKVSNEMLQEMNKP